MEARPERNYGRNLIIRLGLLVAIALLSYTRPGLVSGQQECGGAVVEFPGGHEVRCHNCHYEGDEDDEDDDGCDEGYCCYTDPDGEGWGFDDDGNIRRYNCDAQWDTCEEQ